MTEIDPKTLVTFKGFNAAVELIAKNQGIGIGAAFYEVDAIYFKFYSGRKYSGVDSYRTRRFQAKKRGEI